MSACGAKRTFPAEEIGRLSVRLYLSEASEVAIALQCVGEHLMHSA
jgi:hypothetical protein